MLPDPTTVGEVAEMNDDGSHGTVEKAGVSAGLGGETRRESLGARESVVVEHLDANTAIDWSTSRLAQRGSDSPVSLVHPLRLDTNECCLLPDGVELSGLDLARVHGLADVRER